MTKIVGYDNLELIGQGGFALVYRARQLSVGRDVAIKLLSDPTPDHDLIRRFQRESRAVGALSWHPHIAAVVDAGATELGQAYIVFELIDGGSLEDRLETGPMRWQHAVSSMIQVADAVEAAHRADVLHRDIKPANILVDRLGVAKLGDFGIASMQDGTKTETGMLATTVAHAAPELFDGQPASTATDVYALGSTLHTLVSGAPPFEPVTSERIAVTISRIAAEPPPQLETSSVPEPVATAIVHALAKQPQYRPRSAEAFGQALQNAQRRLGEPVTAMPFSDARADDGRPDTRGGVQASQAASSHHGALATPVPSTRDVPITDGSADHDGPAPPAKPLQTTVRTLLALAVILLAVIGGVLLFDSMRAPLATTAGGVEIAHFTALDATEMNAYPALQAIDGNDATYWGVAPSSSGENIVGTTYVLKLEDPVTVTEVGLSNGASVELGRVSEVRWAASLTEHTQRAAGVIEQAIPDAPGAFTTRFGRTTDTVVLLISELHDPDAANVGIAEILLVTE